ncbi:hypothetical protein GCM10010324_49080 [Streptomyces hiroshimensis]|uniref:Uncharacterized protein n=1 Tax=Streptomyces hiroshimensis TaxID=66424 RepID=A0ABQ2YWR5_9ACTN|nr:hypothetical protein GCM10010324_49080 [Streptomyces hiroshimensis]
MGLKGSVAAFTTGGTHSRWGAAWERAYREQTCVSPCGAARTPPPSPEES